jgi:transcription termination/antitermination protein NusA
VIVPVDQMSLAIGKDGQNARLAYKLTGWRIDIKDPETLRGEDGDFFFQPSSPIGEVPEDIMGFGRQPRLVRPDGTFSIRDKEFGPLPHDLVAMSVDVEVLEDEVQVYYNRELRARFDFETGRELSLTEEESSQV